MSESHDPRATETPSTPPDLLVPTALLMSLPIRDGQGVTHWIDVVQVDHIRPFRVREQELAGDRPTVEHSSYVTAAGAIAEALDRAGWLTAVLDAARDVDHGDALVPDDLDPAETMIGGAR
jgi:hypothetical protein